MEINEKFDVDKELDECILESDRTLALMEIQHHVLHFMRDLESALFEFRYGVTAYNRQLFFDPVDDETLKRDISQEVMPKELINIINDENSDVYGIKTALGDDVEDNGSYFMIMVPEGLYFFLDNEEAAFVKYEDLKHVSESMEKLEIKASGIMWFKNGEPNNGKEEKCITFHRTDVNGMLLHSLRRGLWSVIRVFHGGPSFAEWEIKNVITDHIERIPKESYYKPYLETHRREDEERKKYDKIKKNALKGYAAKARCDDVIGFIDTSFFKNGKEGILFAKDGLAFNYLSKPVFIRFDEIQTMDIVEGGPFKIKELVFYGRFREYSMDYSISKVYVSDVYFDIDVLKDCVEQILCVA